MDYPNQDQVEKAVQQGKDLTQRSSEMLTEDAVKSDDATELLEQAWGIIANAGGGDWTTQSAEWQAAAASWRDRFLGGK